jgi:hypothetical protein
MPTPDVRVKLSAEGTQQVVAALKKVQSESNRAATAQATGFGRLNSVLGNTTGLLTALGVTVGLITLKNFIGNAINAADTLKELAGQTGASVRNLSALSLVARTADSDIEQVGSALMKMNKSIGEAIAGAPAMGATLRDLGLDLKDFKGKDAVEIFELIAKRLVAIPDAALRGRAAMQIFGRSGAQLIPTMRALAEEGLGNVIRRAEQLGVLIDVDLARASDKIKDDVEILKMQSEAMGVRFVSGFGPQLSQTLQSITGDLAQTTKSWEVFGNAIGYVIKFIVSTVANGFDTITTLVTNQVFRLTAGAKALWMIAKGRADEAKAYWQEAMLAADENYRAFEARVQARAQAMGMLHIPVPATTEEGGGGGEEEGADPAELAAKRAQVMQGVLDREIAMSQMSGSLRNKAEKRAFDEGLKDVHAYYAARRQIAEDSFAKTEEVLNKKRELLAAEVDPTRRLQDEAKIEDELGRARLQREEEIADATHEEAQAVRQLSADRLTLEQKLLEAQGRRQEAALMGIDEEIRKTDLLLRQQGVGDAERERTLDRLRRTLTTGIGFDEAKQEADAAIASLDLAIADIDRKVAAGMMAQFEGEQRILAIESERLDVLQRLAEGLRLAAIATGDPEKIAQAEDFAQAVADVGVAVEGSKISFQQFKATALDAGTDALADFFDTGIEKSKTFGDAFRSMAAGVVNALRRMAAELLAVAIMKKIAGVFGLSFSEGGAAAIEKAAGGLIHGPGSWTSDSIPARVSRGEYIMPAARTMEPGVLAHLEDIRRQGSRAMMTAMTLEGPRRAFAEGGLVSPEATSAAAGDSRLLVGLDEGLILKALDTPNGHRILVRTISRSRRAVNSALGG